MSDQLAEDGSKPRFGLGRWWVPAGVVVLVIVFGLLFVLFSPGHKPSSAPPTVVTVAPTTSAPPVPSGTPVQHWADTGCNGTTGSAEIPTSAPAGIVWVPISGMSVPTSPTLGPRRLTGPLRECFQHSPMGAVMALVNIFDAAFTAPTAAAQVQILQQQMTAGSARDALVAQAQAGGGSTGSAAGFQLGACTPARCVINLAQVASGYYSEVSTAVVWVDGDWRLDGSIPLNATGSTVLPAGYVVFQPGA